MLIFTCVPVAVGIYIAPFMKTPAIRYLGLSIIFCFIFFTIMTSTSRKIVNFSLGSANILEKCVGDGPQ